MFLQNFPCHESSPGMTIMWVSCFVIIVLSNKFNFQTIQLFIHYCLYKILFHALDKSSDLKDRSPGYIEVIGHCVPLNSVDSRGHVDKPLEFLTIRDFQQNGRQGANSFAGLCFLELNAVNDLKIYCYFPR